MSAIWKFPVPFPAGGRAFIDMPDGSQIISAGIQQDDMVVWAVVPDQRSSTHCRHIIVANTGADFALPVDARFVGTVTHAESGIVWHVFDGGAS